MIGWVCLLGASPRGARALTGLGVSFAVLSPPGPTEQGHLDDAIAILPVSWDDEDGIAARFEVLETVLGQALAIVSFTELGQRPAALLAKRLGRCGSALAPVELCRDKTLMRHALAHTKLAWRFAEGSAPTVAAAIRAALSDRRWIIKPRSGFGSRDISVVASTAEVDEWLAAAGTSESWIAEELANGPEFSVEAVTWAPGVHQILGITDKVTTGPPHFVELGHVCPARVSAARRQRIEEATTQVLDELEFASGASHIEMKFDPELGVCVIEAHTRPGGDSIPELLELATGVDQYSLAISSTLGLSGPDGHAAAEGGRAAAVHLITASDEGQVRALRRCGAEAGSQATIVRQSLDVRLGDQVGPPRSSDDRLGYAVATAADAAQAMAAARHAASTIRIDVEP